MSAVEPFWAMVEESLAGGTFFGATLSKRRASAPAGPAKLTVRPAVAHGATQFQWAARFADRETHENLDAQATGRRIRELLGGSFEEAHVFTAQADFGARIAGDGRLVVRRGRPTRAPVEMPHNRSKGHLIPENVPCGLLAEIGVMTPAGKVRASRQAKFRQINRFLELVDDVVDRLPPTGTLQIVDFGCGKSYLTFALHHLLTRIRGRAVRILGLDRKADVAADCARLAQKLGCAGLEFRVGEIADAAVAGPVDLTVSLHACDTATDDALAQSVAWEAAAILAVPCCQHELAEKMTSADLSIVCRHGVLRERLASIATDALRAQALEACGYKTQVIEFIDMEHTAKNLLIRAVRRQGAALSAGAPSADAARAAYAALKESLGVTQIACDRILAQVEPSHRSGPRAGTSGLLDGTI